MPKLSNKVYDTSKWVLTIVIPAFNIAIAGLGAELGFNANKVVAVVSIIATFFGAIFMISSAGYKKEDDDHGN